MHLRTAVAGLGLGIGIMLLVGSSLDAKTQPKTHLGGKVQASAIIDLWSPGVGIGPASVPFKEIQDGLILGNFTLPDGKVLVITEISDWRTSIDGYACSEASLALCLGSGTLDERTAARRIALRNWNGEDTNYTTGVVFYSTPHHANININSSVPGGNLRGYLVKDK